MQLLAAEKKDSLFFPLCVQIRSSSLNFCFRHPLNLWIILEFYVKHAVWTLFKVYNECFIWTCLCVSALGKKLISSFLFAYHFFTLHLHIESNLLKFNSIDCCLWSQHVDKKTNEKNAAVSDQICQNHQCALPTSFINAWVNTHIWPGTKSNASKAVVSFQCI